MCRSALLVAVVLAFACGQFGCRSRTRPIQPQGDAAVVLSTTAKRTTHTAKVANRVIVTLPPVDLTTHEWQISAHDTRYLRQLTAFLPPKTPDDGATITFLALQATPGRSTRVRFVLLPAGTAREATPIDGHDLLLAIQ